MLGHNDFVIKVPNAEGVRTLAPGATIRIGWRTEDCRALDAFWTSSVQPDRAGRRGTALNRLRKQMETGRAEMRPAAWRWQAGADCGDEKTGQANDSASRHYGHGRVAAARDRLPSAAPAAARQLTIVSWGGAYQESQRKAYFEPYMADDRHQDRRGRV